jgi:hypothetical protein
MHAFKTVLLAVSIAACAQIPDEVDVLDGGVRTSSPLAEMTSGSAAVEYQRLRRS